MMTNSAARPMAMAMMMLLLSPRGLSVKLGSKTSGDGVGSGDSDIERYENESTGAAVEMHKMAARIVSAKKVAKRAMVSGCEGSTM